MVVNWIKKRVIKAYRMFRPLTPEQEAELKRKSDYEYLVGNGVETEYGFVELGGLPIINKAPGSVIKIGKGVKLVSISTINSAGINHPVILATHSADSVIEIKDNAGLSGCSINAVNRCEVGENAMIGANVNIWDTDFHPLDPESRLRQQSIFDAATSPITIGKNVWIGANSTILKGVTIGDNSVIATMSLVNKDIPSNTLSGGVPAKIIKTF